MSECAFLLHYKIKNIHEMAKNWVFLFHEAVRDLTNASSEMQTTHFYAITKIKFIKSFVLLDYMLMLSYLSSSCWTDTDSNNTL